MIWNFDEVMFLEDNTLRMCRLFLLLGRMERFVEKFQNPKGFLRNYGKLGSSDNFDDLFDRVLPNDSSPFEGTGGVAMDT